VNPTKGTNGQGERGVDPDVDLLVVLHDDVDKTEFEEKVRNLAYDMKLECGIVLSRRRTPHDRLFEVLKVEL
jgi:hypothetical protein